MKVVATSNHDDESYRERVVAQNLEPEQAEQIAKELNFYITDSDPTYYQAKPDDYVPWLGMEDLVK